MKCQACGYDVKWTSEGETLVGFMEFIDDKGRHWHNDNCLKRYYACQHCGYGFVESIIRRCNNDSCDWRGKDRCFCHPGLKVDDWTDPPKKYAKEAT